MFKPFEHAGMEMKHKYINSIKEVTTDDITIGFIARRSVILGVNQETIDGWMVTKSVNPTLWAGNYTTRKEAREALNKGE